MKYPAIIKKEKEITLLEFEILWGQPDCEDGLSLFKQSHASASDGVKADSSDLIILPVSCGDTLKEAK